MHPTWLIRRRVLSRPWYSAKGCHDCSSCHRHSCSLSPWVSKCLCPAAAWRACACPNASLQGYWQGALATPLIPTCRNINNCTQINWQPRARRMYHYMCPVCGLIYLLKTSFGLAGRSCRDVITGMCGADECCALPFASCPKKPPKEPEEKVVLMSAPLRDWCFSPLACESIYFIITRFTPWLCTSWGLGVRSTKRAVLIAYWNSQLWWMDTR